MGKGTKRGWRSVVKEGDTLGDHFHDVADEDATREIDLNALTIHQVRNLQKRHCRQAGEHAGAQMRNHIKQAHARAGHGDDAEKEDRQLSRLHQQVAKLTGYLAPDKIEGCCPNSVARRHEELAQAKARLDEINKKREAEASARAACNAAGHDFNAG